MSLLQTTPAQPLRERTLTAQLMPLVSDLAAHRYAIYWSDFLLCIAIFWASFCTIAYRAAAFDALAVAMFIVAVLALYRASCFMHEIVHLPRSALTGFRWAWDLLCGIPMLLPSYFYASHVDHHAALTYGTDRDPEYLPLLHESKASMAMLVAGTLIAPLTLWLRFAVITPLAWCIPALRALVDARFSSVTLHPHYRAEVARLLRPRLQARIAELLTTLWVWGCTASVAAGIVPLSSVLAFLSVVMTVLLMNMARTALTHHYQHDGAPLTHAQQIADSVTWGGGGVLVELFAPLGLRYHALHHLFPYLPYHALPQAHARLMAAGAIAHDYQTTDRSRAAPAGTASRT